jgi:hypothetical protein
MVKANRLFSAVCAFLLLSQLVLDTNGDNKVSESEILSAAKEVLAKLHTAGVAGEVGGGGDGRDAH